MKFANAGDLVNVFWDLCGLGKFCTLLIFWWVMVKVCSFGMRGCLGIPSIDLFPDLFVIVVDKDV